MVKNIEEIREGDLVYAYELENKKVIAEKISATFVRETNQLIKLQFGGEIIFTTKEHPFYVNGDWVEASKLRVGDRLFTDDKKRLFLGKVAIIDTLVKVYNFVVEDEHNYFVGKNKVLVHNSDPCWSVTKTFNSVQNAYNHWVKHGAEFPEFQNGLKYVKGAKIF